MGWICGATTALTACQKGSDLLGFGLLLANEKVEQLVANRLTTPQDAIASLLQRLVLPALVLLPRSLGVEVTAEQLFYRQPILTQEAFAILEAAIHAEAGRPTLAEIRQWRVRGAAPLTDAFLWSSIQRGRA